MIVVPASTLANWKKEIERFSNLSLYVYHGSQNERIYMRHDIKNQIMDREIDIVICTYTLFERESGREDRNFLNYIKFDYLVLDEAHCIKNANSSRYSNLKRLRRACIDLVSLPTRAWGSSFPSSA